MLHNKNNSAIQRKRNANSLGWIGETCVMLYFFLLGYNCLGRRYRTPFGELDLIFQRRNLIVFVEVKTRSVIKEQNYHIVSSLQMKNIKNAAKWFAGKKPNSVWRVDVFVLSKNIFQTRHFRNVTA